MTPIERAARAVARVHLQSLERDPHNIDGLVDQRWTSFIPHVHAALAAVREPSEGMLVAMSAASGNATRPRDCAAMFVAGMDAARGSL